MQEEIKINGIYVGKEPYSSKSMVSKVFDKDTYYVHIHEFIRNSNKLKFEYQRISINLFKNTRIRTNRKVWYKLIREYNEGGWDILNETQ